MRARGSPSRDVGLIVLLTAAYFITGRLGLALAYNKVATLLWAPSGIAIAALWLGGRRLAIGVALGAFLTNLSLGLSPGLALAIALGNMSEAVVADVLVERAGLRRGLHRVRDVVAFLALIVGASTLVAAANAVVWLTLLTDQPAARVLSTAVIWWLGDAGGALVVTPMVLAFARPSIVRPARVGEGALLAVLAPGLAGVSFGLVFPGAQPSVALLLLPFPILAWAALRFGLRGATVATALVSIAGVVGTAVGTGPFRTGNVHLDVAGLWSLLATLSVTSMLLAIGLEERDAEAERRLAMQRELERSKRLSELGLLAGGVAHDFNNLLMVIRANADVIRIGDARVAAEAVDTISDAADRAAELTDSLLAYSGRKPLQTRPVDVGKLTRDTARMLGSIVPERIAVHVEVAPGTPLVDGEPSQLRQVLMNLLINALQAIDGEGEVHLTVSADGPRVRLEVRDDGCGMDEHTASEIFQPFFTTKEEGRGLGMAAVLGIVRAHRGEITVASRKGRGTTITVWLPVSAGDDVTMKMTA